MRQQMATRAAARASVGSTEKGRTMPFEPRSNLSGGPNKAGGLPHLLRFLGLHLMLGAAIGVAIVSLAILCDLAGIRQLLLSSKDPTIPLVLLYCFNVITFSSVTMGIGIMTIPFGASGPDDSSSRRIDLGPITSSTADPPPPSKTPKHDS